MIRSSGSEMFRSEAIEGSVFGIRQTNKWWWLGDGSATVVEAARKGYSNEDWQECLMLEKPLQHSTAMTIRPGLFEK